MSEANLLTEMADGDSIQILSFELDETWFGIEIAIIQEVLEYRNVTKVPSTPDFMLGVINLRGKVIPVVDLRRQFGMQLKTEDINSCIIILQIEIESELTSIGVLADRVQEVLEIAGEDINPPPKIGTKVDVACIQGMAKFEDEFVILLDVAKVFSAQELSLVDPELAQIEDTNLAPNSSDQSNKAQSDAADTLAMQQVLADG